MNKMLATMASLMLDGEERKGLGRGIAAGAGIVTLATASIQPL